MKAGVFIFISGFISAFLAAFIIAKSDSWEGLADEFEEGKKAQLLDMSDVQPASSSPTAGVQKTSTEDAATPVVTSEVEDLDL